MIGMHHPSSVNTVKTQMPQNMFPVNIVVRVSQFQQGLKLIANKKGGSCRELFKHKPFKTVREETILGNIVYRT